MFQNAEIIHAYTMSDALADGEVVDLGEMFPDLVRDAGLSKLRVVCTRTVFNSFIELTPAAIEACNNIKGRAYDIIFMAGIELRRRKSDESFLYSLYCVTDNVSPSLVRLRCTPSLTDDGMPCVVIMLPEED